MTIVASADDNTLEQVRKQLAKLVEVVQVHDFKDTAHVERDLMLLTVSVHPEKRGEVIEIISLFRGHIVDVSSESLMVELSGAEEKLEACVELLKPYGILELARTGVIAMGRGMQMARANAGASGPSMPRTRSLNAPAAVALPPS
jgi:acetolactate synthase-1/3 small subunit